MKNFNFIKRLWVDSHEKHLPQRLGHYAAILIMLLTLGVGQMWANTNAWNLYMTGSGSNPGAGTLIASFTSGNNVTWISNTNDAKRFYLDWGEQANNKWFNGTSWSGPKSPQQLYQYGTVNYEHGMLLTPVLNGVYRFSTWDESGKRMFQYQPFIIVGNGTGNWLGGISWANNNETNIAKSSTGVTYSNCNAGEKNFRIVPYGEWDQNHGYDQTTSDFPFLEGGDKNVVFTTGANANITITFDGDDIRLSVAYPITYKDQGGEAFTGTHGSGYPTSHTYGSATALVNPTKTGYLFGGWYTTSNCSGSAITSLSSTGYNAAITLYAKWIPITISEASMDPDEISPSTPTDITFSFKTNAPTGSGYQFRIKELTPSASSYGAGYEANGQALTATSPTAQTYKKTAVSKAAGTYKTQIELYKDAWYISTSDITLTVGSGGGGGGGSTWYWIAGNGAHNGSEGGITTAEFTETATAGVYTLTRELTQNQQFHIGDGSKGYGPQTPADGDHTNVTATSSNINLAEYGAVYWFTFTPAGQPVVMTLNTTTNPMTLSFANPTYTITYKDQGGSAFSGTQTSEPTTHTYGTATTLKIPTKEGYTFGGWYTDSECSTGAIGTASAASLGATAYTANIILYAKWTETKYNVTVSVSNPTAAAGTIACTAAGWVASNNGTAQIGASNVTITTGAANSGYTWGSWVLTGGVTLVSGELTDASITVKATGTGTATYTYAEDLTTGWKIRGGKLFGGSGWDTDCLLQKKPGHSTESVGYYTINVPATNASGGNTNYNFKVIDPEGHWFGLATDGHAWDWLYKRNYGTQTMMQYSTEKDNVQICSDVVGSYEIKVDYTDAANPTVTITFPTTYTLTYSIGSVAGTDGSITSSPSTASGSLVVEGTEITLTAPAEKTGYTWKGWYTDAAGTTGQIDDDEQAITITMDDDKTLYACYTLNNHAITHSAASNGSYTIKVGSASAVSTNTNSDYGKAITLAATPATGYHLVSWSVKKTSDASVSVSVSSNQFIMPDYPVTVSATFAANTYTVVFNKHKGDYYGTVTGTMENQNFTYDAAATALRANTYALTGYTFLGWSTKSDQDEANFNASTHDYDYLDGASVSNLTDANGGTVTMYAIWRPIQYTITYNANGGTCGTSSQTAYFYNSVTGVFPVAAKTNKHFNGWYTAASDGTQLATNSAWLENVTDYLTSYKWIKPIDTEVFAQYSDPAMGTTTFSTTAVAKGGTVTVYPHVTIAPDDSYSIWLELQNMDGTPVATQPTAFSTAVGEVESVLQKTFTAPTIGSTYKVVATMRAGSSSSGTVLATAAAASFEVETDHVITIVYQDASGNTIHPSGMTTALQSEYTEVTAPDILGYSFSNWESSNLTDMWFDTDEAHDADNNPANIKAQANATLIAHYNEKEMIYFYNNLGWEDVWVYFYSAGGWWDNAKGSGSSGANCLGHGHMTQIAGTNVWYLDYTNTANTGGANVSSSGVVCFNKYEQNGYDPFYGTECAYRSDFCSNATMPMYVPHTTPSKVISEKSTNYYNYGYWMHYPNQTGYQLRVYNQALTDGAVEQTSKSTDFVASASIPMPFTATMSLEAGQTLYFKVSTQDGKWYHNANTMTAANHEQWEILNESGNNTGITATAAGDYTFTLYYDIHSTDAATAEPKFRISVEYPLSEGDYRLMYSDNAHSAKVPSHIIHNVADNVDTVNFYVRKGQSPVIRVDKCANIAANGTITWTEGVTTNLVSGKTFDKDTVYNIIVTVNEGATNVNYTAHEYYSGNYYIRTDAVSNGWDHYTVDADHQMVYSEYSMTLATNPYTYYKAKWATHGTNIKAVVATDYSPAVSDTLKGDDVISGLEPTVPGTGDAGANIRFSYNASTNTLYRAYLAGAQGGAFDPDFLKLTEDPDNNKMKDDGDSDIDYITFTDDGNWLYSATITASPGLQGALTAKYNGHTQTFYTTGTTILGGEGSEAQSILLRYDFKTGRLIRAWLPNGDITKDIDLQADMILIRHGQSDEPNGGVTQLTFTNGSVLNVETAYGVIELRYNDMVGQMNSWSDATSYRYCYYYLSFPFDVKISTIIGPGRYDYEWDIQQYRGDLRASEGWFLADGRTTFWETMPQSGTLHKNVGYLLRLSRADFNVKVAGGVWDNKSAGSKLYFYFPSTSALGTITDHTDVPLYVPEHVCEIDRIFTQDIEAGKTTEALGGRNHKYTDSNWNMIGSPLFENQTGSVVSTTALYDSTAINYLYTWNYSSNSLSVTRAHNFTFNSMYGYMVQFAGQINFTGASIGAAVAARRLESEKNYTIEMQLFKGDTQAANTYIELKEDGHDNYMLNEDLYLMASGKAAIYTYAGGYDVAANILSVNNHVIPVGVKTNAAGEYTFSMPSDFDGTVVLVDNFDGSRTDLSLGDYSVNLPKGTIEDRFTLEINIERSSATDIEGIEGGTIKDGKAHKFVRDGIMYILRDGAIYDAMGKRVK